MGPTLKGYMKLARKFVYFCTMQGVVPQNARWSPPRLSVRAIRKAIDEIQKSGTIILIIIVTNIVFSEVKCEPELGNLEVSFPS